LQTIAGRASTTTREHFDETPGDLAWARHDPGGRLMAGSETAVGAGSAATPPGGDRSIETKFQWGFRQYLGRYGPAVLVLVNLACFFVVWQLVAQAKLVNPLFLPSVTGVVKALKEGFSDGTLGTALVWSAKSYVIGMGIACAIGIPLGLLMGASKVTNAIFGPYMWGLHSVPSVATVPLLILIFGFDVKAELTLIILSAVFPIMINCMAGVKTVEPSLLRAGHVFGARKFDLYRRIIFPYTLPFILSGVNQGLTRGLVGLVVGEIFGGNNGLGFLIVKAQDSYNSPELYAVLMLLVIAALGIVQAMRWVEARAAPWRDQAIEA
jgi:ABC-type nitrate/sulfonate/bicarbonate transport system permease component